MGDPKKLRRNYRKPNHPWQKSRIEEEKQIMENYGLKTKKEVWKMHTTLKKFYSEAKRLIADPSEQAKFESENLLNKLISLGLVKPGAKIHDILNITMQDLLERRLQSIIIKKSLARTQKQARQFIVHGHILVNGQKLTRPSYLVTEQELKNIEFNPKSALYGAEHPERVKVEEVKQIKNEKEQQSKTE